MAPSVRSHHPAAGSAAVRPDAAAAAERETARQLGSHLSDRDSERLIASLYQSHALAMVRTALLLLGDKTAAEDVVQDAFIGLYRALPRLTSTDKAVAYLRASVVNGCRSIYRGRRRVLNLHGHYQPDVWSAESAVMAREDIRLALDAVSRLPRRAREVLALRYYLDMSDGEIATTLAISRGNVSATASRALAVLARELKEAP